MRHTYSRKPCLESTVKRWCENYPSVCSMPRCGICILRDSLIIKRTEFTRASLGSVDTEVRRRIQNECSFDSFEEVQYVRHVKAPAKKFEPRSHVPGDSPGWRQYSYGIFQLPRSCRRNIHSYFVLYIYNSILFLFFVLSGGSAA